MDFSGHMLVPRRVDENHPVLSLASICRSETVLGQHCYPQQKMGFPMSQVFLGGGCFFGTNGRFPWFLEVTKCPRHPVIFSDDD